MKKINTYSEYTSLCSARLRRGVRTNEFSNSESCRREIEKGMLYARETDDALLLLRDRGSHLRMNFYLQTQEDLQLPSGRSIVTEIAYRKRDTALAETVNFWRSQGFSLCFYRTRLCCPAESAAPAGDVPVHVAAPEDLETAASRLARNFDALTGCLPLKHELDDSIQKGEIILTEHGILQFKRDRNSSEIRHLAVDETYRGCGEAQALISRFFRETSEQKKIVWVRQGNTAAEAIYKENGFVPDNWTSAVLIRMEDD